MKKDRIRDLGLECGVKLRRPNSDWVVDFSF